MPDPLADLATALRVAIEDRIGVAQAMLGACAGGHRHCGDECEEFQALNDPARILRDCKRDLSVLKRHECDESLATSKGYRWCFWCSEDGIDPILVVWPCTEIRELAEEYGIEVSTVDDQPAR